MTTLELIGAIVLVGNTIATGFILFKRSGAQNTSDDATASKSFREISVSLSAEIREQKKRIDELEAMLEKAHLEVTLGVEIGKKPEVLFYKWTTTESNKQ